MITVKEAEKLINKTSIHIFTEKVPFSAARGKILSEVIKADRDFPPFNRVTMDGIAIAFSAFAKGRREFLIEDTQLAGMEQKILQNTDCAIEIMTGAICPANCDTIIRFEDISIETLQGKRYATLLTENIRQHQNIHFQGEDKKAGEVLMEENTKLGVIEMATLAGIGKSTVLVRGLPRISIISTGDELVDIGDTPLTHQIRRSNVYAMQAALQNNDYQGDLYHLPDKKEMIKKELDKILATSDILILSGGVSKGVSDFIPIVLEELGVQKIFHQVAQRPGKPFWFGQKGDKIVFALPGNPVSSLLCFYKYVLPFIQQQSGIPIKPFFAQLAEDIEFKPELTFFVPVKLRQTADAVWLADIFKGNGSGDYINLLNCNAFLELPAEKNNFKAGEVYPCILFGT